MIKLATIKPNEFPIQGEINMALTHLLIDDEALQERWLEDDSYKILDNSAFELGESMDFNVVLHVADKIEASEVVLPDVFRDSYNTLLKTAEGLQIAKDRYADEIPYKLMAVPQGETLEEWLECYHALCKMEGISVISINRDSAKFFGTRLELCKYLEATDCIYADKDYHLLGMQDNILEIVDLQEACSWVRSIDSCFAYLIARERYYKFDPNWRVVADGIERSSFKTSIDFNEDYVHGVQRCLDMVLEEIDVEMKKVASTK